MKNVLLVGAGNLGKRHLQSLKSSAFDLNITVVDPSPKSREAAQQVYDSVEQTGGSKVLSFSGALDEVRTEPHLAIIATPASGRYQLFSAVVEMGCGLIVLEKVAFNSVTDIENAKSLAISKGTKVWVNCPRRLNPIYQNLQRELLDERVKEFEVNGINFGLACNFIHFMDLFAYLEGRYDYSLDFSGIERLVQSKRNSYIELLGSIDGAFSEGATFKLTCGEAESGISVVVSIKTDQREITIDEVGGHFSINHLSASEEETLPFTQPYQSQLTGPLVDEIFSTGTCGLTSLEESMALHLPFISGAYDLYAASNESNSEKMVPIT